MRQCGKTTVWLFTLAACGSALGQLPPPTGNTQADVPQNARLFIAQRTIDLGEVIEGKSVEFSYEVANHGADDLIIEQAKASCGCTVVKLKKAEKTIPPGGKLDLRIIFDSTGRGGKQNKHITLYTSDPAEPKVRLEFKAVVKQLFLIRPPRVLNMKNLRRGETLRQTIDIHPEARGTTLEVLGAEFTADAPMAYEMAALENAGDGATRITLRVTEDAALGLVNAHAVLKLKVNGEETERRILLRGQVVGDLIVQPKVLDTTRQVSTHGKRLAPVVIRATNERPFEILSATAGPNLDVSCTPTGKSGARTSYECVAEIREDAPPGPFGATLKIRTDSLDQPVVAVPVYGEIGEIVRIRPPMILLRNDGTPAGTARRLKIQAAPEQELDLIEATSDIEGVEFAIDWEASKDYTHLRYLQVKLTDQWSGSPRAGVLTIKTNVPHAETIEVPITVLPAN